MKFEGIYLSGTKQCLYGVLLTAAKVVQHYIGAKRRTPNAEWVLDISKGPNRGSLLLQCRTPNGVGVASGSEVTVNYGMHFEVSRKQLRIDQFCAEPTHTAPTPTPPTPTPPTATPPTPTPPKPTPPHAPGNPAPKAEPKPPPETPPVPKAAAAPTSSMDIASVEDPPLKLQLLHGEGAPSMQIHSLAPANRKLAKNYVFKTYTQGGFVRSSADPPSGGIRYDVTATSTLVCNGASGEICTLKALVEKLKCAEVHGYQKFPLPAVPAKLVIDGAPLYLRLHASACRFVVSAMGSQK